jgi:CheY-like chemotaxis protein
MMPHLTGLELIEAIRAQPGSADIPFLLMSAALPPHVDPAALGVTFLRKPADLDELFVLIGRLLTD